MLTPAEEVGLTDRSLAARVRRGFARIPARTVLELRERVGEEAAHRYLVYLRDGVAETVPIMLCPIPVLPEQLAYVHYTALTIQNALKRLPDLYVTDAAVREVLRLTPAEEEWLWDCWSPSHRHSNPVFGRLDAVIDFTSPRWQRSLWFVEPNLSGIGGLHMVPACERLLAEIVVPVLEAGDRRLRLEVGQDLRDLLAQEILDHLQSIGRRAESLCFVEPKYAGHGPDEQQALAAHFRERHGLQVLHADPAELVVRNGEVWYGDSRVDLAYRDYSVLDLIKLRDEQSEDVEPMRLLLRENRMISSIAAEIDQKSCWEILSDSRFCDRYFSVDERQLFRRHIPWTRLLADRQTVLPRGEAGDLLAYVRGDRDHLVIKPNRSYGGEGVVLGQRVSQSEWDVAIERALAGGERCVVQEAVPIPVQELPVIGSDGSVQFEPFFVVMGFAASPYGVGVLGRASQQEVVNVARQGGLCAMMIGHSH
jgi:hypothetical protein